MKYVGKNRCIFHQTGCQQIITINLSVNFTKITTVTTDQSANYQNQETNFYLSLVISYMSSTSLRREEKKRIQINMHQQRPQFVFVQTSKQVSCIRILTRFVCSYFLDSSLFFFQLYGFIQRLLFLLCFLNNFPLQRKVGKFRKQVDVQSVQMKSKQLIPQQVFSVIGNTAARGYHELLLLWYVQLAADI